MNLAIWISGVLVFIVGIIINDLFLTLLGMVGYLVGGFLAYMEARKQ